MIVMQDFEDAISKGNFDFGPEAEGSFYRIL